MKQVPEHADPVVGSFSDSYTTSSSRLPTTDHDVKEEMSRAEELDDVCLFSLIPNLFQPIFVLQIQIQTCCVNPLIVTGEHIYRDIRVEE